MAVTSNDETLIPEIQELASGKNVAAVATMSPGGRIQNQILWLDVRDGRIVLNTETHRRKYRNLLADPRITVLVRDEEASFRYGEVRGEVTEMITGPEARAHINTLSNKYGGSDFPDEAIKSERVMLVVTPHRQVFIDQSKDTSD